jgi:hypothetical protein
VSKVHIFFFSMSSACRIPYVFSRIYDQVSDIRNLLFLWSIQCPTTMSVKSTYLFSSMSSACRIPYAFFAFTIKFLKSETYFFCGLFSAIDLSFLMCRIASDLLHLRKIIYTVWCTHITGADVFFSTALLFSSSDYAVIRDASNGNNTSPFRPSKLAP